MNEALRICIIDDELKSAEVLEALINEVEEVEHDITIFTDPAVAAEKLQSLSPELLFLDIKMPGMSGIDLLRSMPERAFEVIFTTAYEQYAILAIRQSAFDYLLKPVEDVDLTEAFARFRKHQRGGIHQRLDSLNAQLVAQMPEHDKICLRTSDRKYFVDIANIIRCEANGNYTSFYLSDGSRLMSSKTLKDHEESLSQGGFLRVHKSHLINPRHIHAMISTKALQMADDAVVPLARRRRKFVAHLLNAMIR